MWALVVTVSDGTSGVLNGGAPRSKISVSSYCTDASKRS